MTCRQVRGPSDVSIFALCFRAILATQDRCLPARVFSSEVDDRGVTHTYQLAEHQVTLTYQDAGREQTFTCRQITRRNANGH